MVFRGGAISGNHWSVSRVKGEKKFELIATGAHTDKRLSKCGAERSMELKGVSEAFVKLSSIWRPEPSIIHRLAVGPVRRPICIGSRQGGSAHVPQHSF